MGRWLFAWGMLLTGCQPSAPEPLPNNELVVALIVDPVIYQASANEQEGSGFEYDLIRAFADEIGLPLRIVPVGNADQLRQAVLTGKAHLGAALPILPDSQVHYTSPLREARLLVVQHIAASPVSEAGDLAGHELAAQAGGIAAAAFHTHPSIEGVKVREIPTVSELDLLADIAERRVDLGLTDSAHFDVAANFYPDLAVSIALPDIITFGWVIGPSAGYLHDKAERFIARVKGDGTLARIFDRYFGHVRRITPDDAAQLLDDMRTVLPRYRNEFQQAQALTGIDWRLLAALAYQESKWNPLATSPTKVRGMMMLTEETADRLGVGNRLDVRESVRAGARYLSDLIDQLPATIPHPDRLWLALAAYNLGMGHLNGARQIALGMNRDASSWYEMKSILPLMARPEYYRRLKAGRARGGEAVVLVENIRTYYDILCRFEPRHFAPLQTGLTMQ